MSLYKTLILTARTKILCAVAVMVILALNAPVQAEIMVWDAYDQFNTTANVATNLWSYYDVDEGANTGYAIFPNYDTFPYQTYSGWMRSVTHDAMPAVGADDGKLRTHPGEADQGDKAGVVGWNSPITGTVKAEFSLADENAGATPTDPPT